MLCASCSTTYEAVNQHSECPKCGAVAGTIEDRSLDDKHDEVKTWFEDYSTGTEQARKDSERDRDYYDGIQWTAEEIQELNDRGQAVVTKNRIFKKLNFLFGMEIRNRKNPKALPRTPAHESDVGAITDAIRYVLDASRFDMTSSLVWADELIEGHGGAVVEHSVRATKDGPRVEIEIRHVPWDRIWYDIHSRKHDFSDAEHMGITTWWDKKAAKAFYRKRQGLARDWEEKIDEASGRADNSSQTHDDKPDDVWTSKDGGRERIRINECYYRELDEESGMMRWYTCHYTSAGFIEPPRPVGYVNEDGADVNPMELVSAFCTRQGVRYGLVRHMISAQDEINKRSSKALHLLSVDQTIAEEDAVLRPDDAKVERAKPNGWVTVQRGALAEGRVIFEKGQERAQGQFAMLAEAKAEIDTIGPEIPQVGASGDGSSGRALMMRQQIGSLELAPPEDHHANWKHRIARQVWWRIRQLWPSEMWLRVDDDENKVGYRFVGLNRQMTRGQRFSELMAQEVPFDSALQGAVGSLAPLIARQAQAQLPPPPPGTPPEALQQALVQVVSRHPLMAQPLRAADVATMDIDIVLDDVPDTSTIQLEEYEALTQQMPAFLGARPDLAGAFMELVIEASQLRSKKKLLAILKKGPDPQTIQMQKQMQMLGAAKAKADVDVTASQAQLNQAKTAQTVAEAQVVIPKAQAEIQGSQASAMNNAASAGAKTGGLPQ